MNIQFTFYINNLYFNSVYDSGHFGDRPEFYRTHEKSLWTVYQLLKSGINNLVITNKAGLIEKRIYASEDFKTWVNLMYPEFSNQLDELLYTKYPHPNDILEKNN